MDDSNPVHLKLAAVKLCSLLFAILSFLSNADTPPFCVHESRHKFNPYFEVARFFCLKFERTYAKYIDSNRNLDSSFGSRLVSQPLYYVASSILEPLAAPKCVSDLVSTLLQGKNSDSEDAGAHTVSKFSSPQNDSRHDGEDVVHLLCIVSCDSLRVLCPLV